MADKNAQAPESESTASDDPLPGHKGIPCSFGEGRNSDDYDFDKAGGDAYELLVACGDRNLITFNISHDKVGHDSRWYSGLKQGTVDGGHSDHHSLYVSGASYSGKYPPKYFWVRAGKVDKDGEAPSQWSSYLRCSFGDGRNSCNFDFDQWQGKAGKFEIDIAVADPNAVEFNISHNKVGHDTRWYSDLRNESQIPNSKNPKHTPGHKIYVSGATYSGKCSPGRFWTFVKPLAERNPVETLSEKNAAEVIQKLSPWVFADKNASYYMTDVEDYIKASKVSVVHDHVVVKVFDEALPVFRDPAMMPGGTSQVLVSPNIRGGNHAAVVGNTMPVYATLLAVPKDSDHVDIVYRYFWAFQGQTFLSIGGHAPNSAHTSDWESIVVRVPKKDCLNPINYWTSRHGTLRESPGLVDTMSKFSLSTRHAGGPAGNDVGCFYSAQNTHAIYSNSGDTTVEVVTIDYHRTSNTCLKGGATKVVYSNVYPELAKPNADLYQLLKWPHDWGLHVPGGPGSISDDPAVTKSWKTANGRRDWTSSKA
ncbi:hypothetical protein [Microbulbifer sp. TYP-18]|uniref:hypothetical protein n=1 Tax=Microbulbifer sp. TYP-18 TaxID=3230024 RepID=UPI0034C69EDF